MVDFPERRCSRCGTTQPIEDFPWKHRARGQRRTWCRSCAKAYSRDHYQRNLGYYVAKARRNRTSGRAKVRERVDDHLRSHPCVDCGECDIALLEFDHRDPKLKRMAVSRLAEGAGWATVFAEIVKCDVRCANCHRRRTALQFDWSRMKASPSLAPAKPTPPLGRMAPSDANFLRACAWCASLKPLSEFAYRSISKGTLNGHCRKCHAAYRRQHYLNNREDYFRRAVAQTRRKRSEARSRIREHLLSHPCVDCGEKGIATPDFDHVDPAAKVMEVAKMVGHRNWDAIQDEIRKCEVRCANCHRRRTIAQRAEANQERMPVQFVTPRE